MKKLLAVFVFSLVSIIAKPCSGTWNACGPQSISDMVQDAITNCSPGSQFVIVDLCDGNPEGQNHTIYVLIDYIG
jgi:hypothetical protein